MQYLLPLSCTKILGKMSQNKFKHYFGGGAFKMLDLPVVCFKITCKISKLIKLKMELCISIIYIYILKTYTHNNINQTRYSLLIHILTSPCMKLFLQAPFYTDIPIFWDPKACFFALSFYQ